MAIGLLRSVLLHLKELEPEFFWLESQLKKKTRFLIITNTVVAAKCP